MLVLLVSMFFTTGCGSGSSSSPQLTPPRDTPPVAPPWSRWAIQDIPGTGAQGVQLHPAQRSTAADWCVFREWPTEMIHVIANCGGQKASAVLHPRLASGELLVLGTFLAGPDIVLVLYDAARNVPSGRNLGPTIDGVDILRFTQSGAVVTLAELLPLPAFDYPVYGGVTDAGVAVCAYRRCFVLDGTAVVELDTTPIADQEIVEASVHSWGIDALVRPQLNGESGAPVPSTNYSWARISSGGSSIRATVPANCIPYRLMSAQDAATWDCAQTPSQIASLLQFEINRMPHHGMMDFGNSNSEGRVAWSQVYYLNGLMQVAGGFAPNLALVADWSELRHRLRAEVSMLGDRADQGMTGYFARRYSMQRTPLLFALHLGRIATVFDTAERAGLAAGAPSLVFTQLSARLSALNTTVETAVTHQDGGITFDALQFTRGIDFWADGANVPFNYTSAVVHGQLALGGAGVSDRAAGLMLPMLSIEPVATADTWRYWWGVGREGWVAADSVSVNTPNYVGQPGLAHITYRTIDAHALMLLELVRPGSLSGAELANLARLTAQGSLLPAANELASRLPGGAFVFSPEVIYHYARAAAPYEIQSQVWVLEQLVAPGATTP